MAREIEFLDGHERNDHETYDQFDVESSSRRRHPAIWVAAAGVLVAAVVAWIATRPNDPSTPAGAPIRTVTATASPSATPSTATRSSATIVQRSCRAGNPINRQLKLIALRDLPGLTLLPDQSFTCTTRTGAVKKTVSISIAARYKTLLLEVQASRRVGDSGQYVPTPTGLRQIASSEAQSAALNVTVDAYGKSSTKADLQAFTDLASDICLQLVM